MKKYCLILAASLPLLLGAQPQQDEQKINDLLAKMTLEEKIGQMNQLSYGDKLDDGIKAGQIGSILNIVDPAEVNRLQAIAVKESRLGIPLIIGRDVIHGFKTIFPIPIGQAASFNPEVAEESAAVAAAEARSVGIHWTFAPMLDISRDPRWGRLAEGLGEDPYLASVLGSAMVRGFQGKNLSDSTSVAACIKHFAGYGAAEGGRDYNSTNIPPHLMRNVYLEPFKAAVEAGAATLMTSFNENDGIPSSGNTFLLKTVLRNEWKFDGFVVSDWGSVNGLVTHGFCADQKEAAMKATNAGLDMEMVSRAYIRHLPDLVKERKVSEQTIDEAVRNILRIKFRLGLFDNPYVDVSKPSVFYADKHLQAAQKAAGQSVVLLKNNGILPLGNMVKTVALVGPMADAPHDQLGTWIFDGDKTRTITPLAALQQQYGKQVKIIHEKGVAYSRDKSASGIPAAVKAAQSADVVVAVVGEEAILSGEAHSLAEWELKGAQKQLIAELKKVGKPLVVIVMAGRPLTIQQELNAADAMLYSFHPGTMGGSALADILFGKVVPSGKLPMTFPRENGQVPMYYNHNHTSHAFRGNEKMIDDIPLEAVQTSLGNSSYYLDAGASPLFPFGFGLSYSTFEYSDLRLDKATLKQGETVTATVTLKNTGKHEATEVAQLYVRDLTGSIARPVKELKGFRRVSLKAGESTEVSFALHTDDLAFYGIDMKKAAEPGAFKLWVGGDSNAKLEVEFDLQ
ncbi:MAG: glycoside hydrolase family 3 C-terminal domain-containing protein [Prevotellaceae bacterium]|jgi:beta-glucosidase|nr:glycoside hydrolase family 3 C-terminal domain-containing protein [Prevotellaceae bacterium]